MQCHLQTVAVETRGFHQLLRN